MGGSNGGVCKGMPALSEKEREGGSVYLSYTFAHATWISFLVYWPPLQTLHKFSLAVSAGKTLSKVFSSTDVGTYIRTRIVDIDQVEVYEKL